MDPCAHSRLKRNSTSAESLLFALVFILAASSSAIAGTVVAGPGTEPRDGTPPGGLLARAAPPASFLDRGKGVGAKGSKSDSLKEADLDEEIQNLRPFCGCVIDTIIVVGNTYTKNVTILREMATKPHTCLDERLIRRDGAYLRGLGYFAEVSIVADRVDPTKCRLVVAVAERSGLFMRLPYPIVNYDFEKGISYGATWKVKNFRGLGEDLSISGLERPDRERGASLSWNDPWFMGRRFGFRVDAGAYRRLDNPVDSEEDYIQEQVGTGATFSVPLSKSLVKQLWLRTNVYFEGRDSRLTLLGSQGTMIRAFVHQNYLSAGGELEYDSRDNRTSTFSGMHHRLRVRRYTSVEGLSQQYVFYGFYDAFYLPAGKNDRTVIVALRGDIREGDLPSYLRMKLGGVRDVRGYSDEETGPVKLIGTLQYRAQLFDPHVFRFKWIGAFDVTMNFIAFVDNGALMESILDIGSSTFHTTAGLGLEIISPFRDLLRLEVASDGTGTPAFYMTAGADF